MRIPWITPDELDGCANYPIAVVDGRTPAPAVQHPRTLLVRFGERLDSTGWELVRDALEVFGEPSLKWLILDLTKTHRIEEDGVGLLLIALQRAPPNVARICLLNHRSEAWTRLHDLEAFRETLRFGQLDHDLRPGSAEPPSR